MVILTARSSVALRPDIHAPRASGDQTGRPRRVRAGQGMSGYRSGLTRPGDADEPRTRAEEPGGPGPQCANPAAMTGRDVPVARRTAGGLAPRAGRSRYRHARRPVGRRRADHRGSAQRAADDPGDRRLWDACAEPGPSSAAGVRAGWNGPEASPVRDVNELLNELAGRFGRIPVVLVGHSMGGRPRCALPGIRW